MTGFFESMVGPSLAQPVMWLFAVILIAILLYVFSRIARSFGGGTFVAGGRNRRQRLAVLDAAAVDGRRRLILVRRDDVEHLLLIGGPTDVVIEQNIKPDQEDAEESPIAMAPVQPVRQPPASREPTDAPEPLPVRPRPQAPSRPTPPVAVAPQRDPVPPRPTVTPQVSPPSRGPAAQQPYVPARRAEPAVPPARPAPAASPAPAIPMNESAPQQSRPQAAFAAPVRTEAPVPVATQRAEPEIDAPTQSSAPRRVADVEPSTPRPMRPSPIDDDELDDALMRELEVTLDEPTPEERAGTRSVDEEMSALLDDLAGQRR